MRHAVDRCDHMKEVDDTGVRDGHPYRLMCSAWCIGDITQGCRINPDQGTRFGLNAERFIRQVEFKHRTGECVRFPAQCRGRHKAPQSGVFCDKSYLARRKRWIKWDKSGTCLDHSEQCDIGIE